MVRAAAASVKSKKVPFFGKIGYLDIARKCATLGATCTLMFRMPYEIASPAVRAALSAG